MTLPSGTVTFLFTDVVGSTALWEQQPEKMQIALAQHDALLRHTLEANGGLVYRTVGDAFCAAFTSAPEALMASAACQLALDREVWPEPLRIQVRIALHTGSVESRDGDYFGQALNRVARLLSAGHGGQILLSDVSHGLCLDTLPFGFTLRSLGEHRLKDLGRPESVYQLCHADLQADFPGLRSLESLPNNLPHQVTSFVGRESELVETRALLEKSRLVTLTGSGGCGKTRLSLQLAADVLDTFAEGAWFVELAALSDPGLVPQAVAGVFGLKEEAGKSILQTLLAYLKERRGLLILDNCEHLLAACASLSDAVLRQCRQVVILASSREGLGIAGETTYRVPSLSLPNPTEMHTAESVGKYEAVQLFIERAEQVRTGFQPTLQNAGALAAVCYRLDGIPLAIELAAARVRAMSVEEVSKRLDKSFSLLTGGSRMALPRQQTLRSLIDWSYDLLNDSEKSLLCRLSVFAGGWTLEAAEGICSDGLIHEEEILDLMTSLVDKSLVVAEPLRDGTRYRLLETVRQYASERLAEGGADGGWQNRHLAYFLRFAEDTEPHLRGADQSLWEERLESEHDNLRSAMGWSSAAGSSDDGLRIAAAIWRFWYVRGHYAEARSKFSALLAENPAAQSPGARAKALNGSGTLAWAQGDFPTARAQLEESIALYRELGNRSEYARAVGNLANVTIEQGDPSAGRAMHEESLAIRRELGDQWGTALSLGNLGLLMSELGDHSKAQALCEESIATYRTMGYPTGTAMALQHLGVVFCEMGDPVAARVALEESLTIRRGLGDRHGIAQSLEGFASVISAQGDFELAVRIICTAERLRAEVGSPMAPSELVRHERVVSAARAAFADDAAFDHARAEGSAMTMDQAIEAATQMSKESPRD